MAFEDYDEYEQSERVQQWLRQNGASIAIGIVLGLLLIFGWQQWKSHRAHHHQQAAQQYQALQKALSAGRNSEADTITDDLVKNFADTAYAVFAVTERGQRQVTDGHGDQAIASLTWAHDHAGDEALKSLTALRLARVQLTAGKADAALATLKAMPAGDYSAMAQELRGDALVQQGHAEQARGAYKAAVASLQDGSPLRATLQVKIDNLPATNQQPTIAKPASTGKQGA